MLAFKTCLDLHFVKIVLVDFFWDRLCLQWFKLFRSQVSAINCIMDVLKVVATTMPWKLMLALDGVHA
jgi:hypothetical protein